MAEKRTAVPLARERLAEVPGIAAAAIDDGVLARLPGTTPPPPPWHTRADAVLWRQRAPATLPSALRAVMPGRLLAGPAVAGVIAYRDTPVGPYGEVVAAVPVLHGGRPRLHVPFMAVDSLSSLHGGRAHWALPKTLANLRGNPAAGGALDAHGLGWCLRARVRPVGPRVPVWLRVTVVQAAPGGTSRAFAVAIRGRARLVMVEVTVAPAGVGRWLRPGRHVGVVLTDARVDVGRPAALTPPSVARRR